MAAKFNRLGIDTVLDLLFYFPRRYEDYTNITQIKDVISTPSGAWVEKSYNERSLHYGRDDKEFGRDDGGWRVTIRGRILGIDNKKTSRRKFTVTEAVVEDGSGTLKVVWFNQPFLKKMLIPGRELILNGKIEYNNFSHEWVMESPNRAIRPSIVPIYGETEGMRSGYISAIVSRIINRIDGIDEFLPTPLIQNLKFKIQNDCERSTLGLLPIQEAIRNIHQPEDSEKLAEAQRRLAFDELFMISLQANITKEALKKEKAPSIQADRAKLEKFIDNLPFVLTSDQKKSSEQIINDIGRDEPMNRLLNGDVGSGKTVIAAIAAYAAILAGYRVVCMCPTSILANQHYETFNELFKKFNISIGLVTSDRQESSITDIITKSKLQISNKILNSNKKNKREALKSDIVIGTQALIQKDVDLKNLGLVIVDEQHRFGVAQRAALQKLGRTNNQEAITKNSTPLKEGQGVVESNEYIEQSNNNLHPHFLSMTATPIPRTLHLALFGDLDVSIIREKPANRKEIKTRFVEPFNREKAYQFIREHIKAGRQAFIICPLIEVRDEMQNSKFKIQNDREHFVLDLFEDDRKTVKQEYEKLQKIFPEFKIGMLHGKMRSKEKDAVMAEFVANRLNILVSTSVVEVGVDVPNASVMMIEDADRFGLAQLHQFRGRVGRAEHQSFCLLFSSTMIPKARKRLESMETTSDGFKLAEIDLETRGPGSIFGTMQSGMLDLRMASLSDHILISQASEAAKKIAQEDPELGNYPKLRERIEEYLSHKHLE